MADNEQQIEGATPAIEENTQPEASEEPEVVQQPADPEASQTAEQPIEGGAAQTEEDPTSKEDGTVEGEIVAKELEEGDAVTAIEDAPVEAAAPVTTPDPYHGPSGQARARREFQQKHGRR